MCVHFLYIYIFLEIANTLILKVPIGTSRKGFDSILMITLAMLPYSTAHVY